MLIVIKCVLCKLSSALLLYWVLALTTTWCRLDMQLCLLTCSVKYVGNETSQGN